MLLHLAKTWSDSLKPKMAPDRLTKIQGPNPAHNRQREILQMDWREKWLSHNSRAGEQYTKDTPEVPGSGEQEALHCRALTGLLLHKATTFESRIYS